MKCPCWGFCWFKEFGADLLEGFCRADKPKPEAMLLQARKPEGGEWIDIFPAQLEWCAKEGYAVRALTSR